MQLNANAITVLAVVRQAIEGRRPIAEIAGLCQSVITDSPGFAYLYAGVLLATHKRNAEARWFFEHVNESPAARALFETLAKNEALLPTASDLDENTRLELERRTQFSQRHDEGVIEAGRDLLIRSTPPPSRLNLLVLGAKRPALISGFINLLAAASPPTQLNVLLVDPTLTHLESCKNHLLKNSRVGIRVATLACTLQLLAERLTTTLKQHGPYWLTLAFGSLSALPSAAKLKLLRSLQPLTQNFLLSDLQVDDDRQDTLRPELVFAVTRHFDYQIEQLERSNLSRSEAQKLTHHHLYQLLYQLTATWRERKTFHADLEHWSEMANQSGFALSDAAPLVRSNRYGVISFAMHLTAPQPAQEVNRAELRT